jgi:hypothetical protein
MLDSPEMWRESAILAIGVILGISPFLIRSLWGHALSKRLAVYEGELAKQLEDYKGELARDFERFKTSLSTEVSEKRTRYAWLHSRRAKVLLRLDRFLAVTHVVCVLGTYRSDKSVPQPASGFATLIECFEYAADNAALLGDDLMSRLDALQNKYFTLMDDAEQLEMEWESQRNNILGDIQPLRDEVRKIIKNMLGVE